MDKSRITKCSIVILTLIIIMLIFYKISDGSILYGLNSFDLNETQLTAFPSNTNLFEIMIPSLITILAIVFTLSQFIISTVQERYSAEIMRDYEYLLNSANPFYWYVLIISFLICVSLIYPLPNLYLNLGLIIFCVVLIFSFIYLLIKYLKYVLDCINPFKFTEIFERGIKSKWENNVNSEDLEESNVIFSNGIRSMGDIALKLMGTYEEGVSIEYIDSIYKSFSNIVLEINEIEENNLDFRKFNIPKLVKYMKYNKKRNNLKKMKETIHSAFETVSSQYYRIYQEALKKESDEISKKVIENMNNLLQLVMKNEWIIG